jgi:putative (di)nucleoside polyphosphate hydrolase
MTDWIDDDGYRANVGIVLMRPDGLVFLGGRPGGRGWQFPQGGIQREESLEAALYRELKEEIGLGPGDVEYRGATHDWLRYQLPKQYVRRHGSPRCIGQKQRWVLLGYAGRDEYLRFDATSEPPEFDRWRWAEFWDPVREVIFFKRDVYRRALHELGRIAFPAGLPAYPPWWESEEALGGDA